MARQISHENEWFDRFFFHFCDLFWIGTFFINNLYTLGQRYRKFVTTRLQFANNNIASLLLSKQSAAPSIKLISVASILRFECPTWNSNLKHYLTCIQINCYCGPNGNSWAGPPTNLHDKKLSNQGLSMNIHSICKIAYVKVWHCLFSHNFFKRFVDALFNPFLNCQVF